MPVGRSLRHTVVLTGGRGMLVDALARRVCADGDRAVVLDHCTAAEVDLRDGAPRPLVLQHDPEDPTVPDSLGSGVDLVVHVAGGPRESSLRGLSSPTLTTLFALHLARVNGARLVVASLRGNVAQLTAVEALTAGYLGAHDVDAALVHVGESYGPGAGGEGVVTRMLSQALAGGPVLLDPDDDALHRPCFVDDAVEGLLAVARGDGGGPFRIGPDHPLSTAEVARAVTRATATTVREVRRRLRGVAAGAALAVESNQAPTSTTEAVRPHGWQPLVALADGLARCVTPVSAPSTPGSVDVALPPAGADHTLSPGGAVPA